MKEYSGQIIRGNWPNLYLAHELEQVMQLDRHMDYPWESPAWQDVLKNNPFLWLMVAQERSGGPIGAFSLWDRQEGNWHLLKIYCQPAWRRRGIAHHFMQWAITSLREQSGEGYITLEVAANNHEALAFYEKCQAQVWRKTSKYYADGQDAWHLGLFVLPAGK